MLKGLIEEWELLLHSLMFILDDWPSEFILLQMEIGMTKLHIYEINPRIGLKMLELGILDETMHGMHFNSAFLNHLNMAYQLPILLKLNYKEKYALLPSAGDLQDLVLFVPLIELYAMGQKNIKD